MWSRFTGILHELKDHLGKKILFSEDLRNKKCVEENQEGKGSITDQ